MKTVKAWYDRRIAAKELNLSGWSRDFSQRIRWEANLAMIDCLYSPTAVVDVVDFGCGTAGFCAWMKDRGRMGRYIGIEMREEAAAAARAVYHDHPLKYSIRNDIPSNKVKVPYHVVVANAVYGFPQQVPPRDLAALKRAFNPAVIVVDFFSTLRPYEPEDPEGYFPFNPFNTTATLVNVLEADKFVLDHSRMPHAFTVGLGFTPTTWEKEEHGSA